MEQIKSHLTATEWAEFEALADRLGLTTGQALSQIHLDLAEPDHLGLVRGCIECPEYPGLSLAGGF